MSVTYKTQFGSLDRYEKGGVQTISDDVKNYAFSNCFEIASKSKPYEKVVFGQNQIYVLEMPARRRRVALVHLRARRVRARDGRRGGDPPRQAAGRADRARRRAQRRRAGQGRAQGREDGLDEDRRAATRACCRRTPRISSRAAKPGVVVLQTCKGDFSIERWAQICQTPESKEHAMKHPPNRQVVALTRRTWLRASTRRLQLPPRRVLRPHPWKTTDGRPLSHTHGHQQLPARADARRGVGLLLRRRQLRPRDRHHQPLQDGGPLRRHATTAR